MLSQKPKPSTTHFDMKDRPVDDGEQLGPERASQRNERVKKRREIPLLSMRLRSSDSRDVNAASVVSSNESPLSALLQPILALFPPAQPAASLAPAFDLKPPAAAKDKQTEPSADVKPKPLIEDEDNFVIYQPSSWTAKRRKPSAATLAYAFDWKNDPFGDSPVAVRGQRTKYPKPEPLPPPPRRFLSKNVKIPLDLSLQLGRREAWGSLASVSEISFASFGSGGSSSNFHELVTPLHDEFDLEITRVERYDTSASNEIASTSEINLASPTRPLREELEKMHVRSPPTSVPPAENEEEDDDGMLESPHTPLTARSVPSDEDSD